MCCALLPILAHVVYYLILIDCSFALLACALTTYSNIPSLPSSTSSIRARSCSNCRLASVRRCTSYFAASSCSQTLSLKQEAPVGSYLSICTLTSTSISDGVGTRKPGCITRRTGWRGTVTVTATVTATASGNDGGG
jgi:hypothetical protein